MERSINIDKGSIEHDEGDDERADSDKKDDNSKIMVGDDENAKREKISLEIDNVPETNKELTCSCMGAFEDRLLLVVDGSLETIVESRGSTRGGSDAGPRFAQLSTYEGFNLCTTTKTHQPFPIPTFSCCTHPSEAVVVRCNEDLQVGAPNFGGPSLLLEEGLHCTAVSPVLPFSTHARLISLLFLRIPAVELARRVERDELGGPSSGLLKRRQRLFGHRRRGGGSEGGGRKEEWPPSELQPMAATLEVGGDKCGGIGMEDWENMLADPAAALPTGNPQSFFQWFDMDGATGPSLKQLLLSGCGGPAAEFDGPAACLGSVADLGFGFETASSPSNANACNPPMAAAAAGSFPLTDFRGSCFASSNKSPGNPLHLSVSPADASLAINPLGAFYDQQLEPIDEKPQIFNTQHLINQQQPHPPQNPSLFLPLSFSQQEQQRLLLPPLPKRHQPSIVDPFCPALKAPFPDSSQEPFAPRLQLQQSFPTHVLSQQHQQRPVKPKLEGSSSDGKDQQPQQLQGVVDQLFKAAELVESGNSVLARGILARLNHQLSPVGKPLQRVAFYFKEALQLLLDASAKAPSSPRLLTPADSPLDVVFKISAYKAFSEISPVLQFANFTSNQALLEALDGYGRIHIIDFDIGLGSQWASFMQELALRRGAAPSLKITAFVSPSSHDPLELSLTHENLSHFAGDLGIRFEFNVVNINSFDSPAIPNLPGLEAIAVNLPSCGLSNPSSPLLLRLVKQLAPKIILCVDNGGERSELPFSRHFLHALQSYGVLLESLDASSASSDAVQKIERHLLRPRIESTVLGRHRSGDKILPWRVLLTSSGFSPAPFSSFTETQAECVVKRLQVRGFHVEKRQASLYLCWQHGELVSVSAWRC
ncbi:hypothetical protein ACLOJK_033361 [Asimina triloba]